MLNGAKFNCQLKILQAPKQAHDRALGPVFLYNCPTFLNAIYRQLAYFFRQIGRSTRERLS
jgi:hypothetical protein